MAKQYEVHVVDSDEATTWERFVTAIQWSTAETAYSASGEEYSRNVAIVTVDEANVDRLKGALDRDVAVLEYCELVDPIEKAG